MSLISLAFSAADRMDVNWLSISGVGCYPPSWYLDICTQRKESFHKELITWKLSQEKNISEENKNRITFFYWFYCFTRSKQNDQPSSLRVQNKCKAHIYMVELIATACWGGQQVDEFKQGSDKLIKSVKMVVWLWLHGPEVAKNLRSLEAEEPFQQKDVYVSVIFMFPFPEELLVAGGGDNRLEKMDPWTDVVPQCLCSLLSYAILFSLKCLGVCDICHLPPQMGSLRKKWR